MPWNKVKAPIVSRLKELRNLRHKSPLGEGAAKIAVVLVFTVCWLLIVLVRSHVANDPITTEGSTLVGLATALQQGAISGRDFQSMYGPATQALAWICTKVTLTRSALDAFGLMTFAFCAASGLLIGGMLTVSVPLRRLSRRHGLSLSDRGLGIASFFWGVVVGGTSGAGIILLSMLLAAGLEGAAVIATDAAISVLIGVVKIGVFGVFGAVDAKVVAIALLIGCVAFPGAFLAKALVDRLPLHVHTAILDAVVICGGLLMIVGALR